jgi:hypothetical protein
MNRNIWGPYFWEVFHIACFDYPIHPTNQDKNNITNFIKYYQKILPCKECRTHFMELLNKYPLNPNNSNLLEWSVFIHNQVNKRLNKPIFEYKNILKKYNSIKKKCTCDAEVFIQKPCKKRKSWNIIIIIIIILIILSLFIYHFI